MNFNWFKEPIPLDLAQLKRSDPELYKLYQRGDLKEVRKRFNRQHFSQEIATPIEEMINSGIEGYLLGGGVFCVGVILLIFFI